MDRYQYKTYGCGIFTWLATRDASIRLCNSPISPTRRYQEVQMVSMQGRAVVAGVEVVVFSGKK